MARPGPIRRTYQFPVAVSHTAKSQIPSPSKSPGTGITPANPMVPPRNSGRYGHNRADPPQIGLRIKEGPIVNPIAVGITRNRDYAGRTPRQVTACGSFPRVKKNEKSAVLWKTLVIGFWEGQNLAKNHFKEVHLCTSTQCLLKPICGLLHGLRQRRR